MEEKIKTFTLRLTEDQLDEVTRKAQELGISKNDYIRNLIDNVSNDMKLDEILKELRDLKKIVESK